MKPEATLSIREAERRERLAVPNTNGANELDDDDLEIARLAKLDVITYERERTSAAEHLGMRASVLDKLIAGARDEGSLADTAGQGKPLTLPEREPWHEPVAGDPLLEELVSAIRNYVVMPEDSRPLFAAADAAGGKWPALARKIAASMAVILGGDTSIRVSLLSDIRDIFDAKGVTSMSSADMVDELTALEGRPWCEWKNSRPITTTGLARLLAAFPITPANGRFDGINVTKGYKRSQFEDEWARYLAPPGNRTATPLQTAENLGFEADHHPLQPPVCSGSQSPGKPQKSAICSVVADGNPLPDEESDEWRL